MAVEQRTRGRRTTLRVRYFDDEGKRRSREFTIEEHGSKREARRQAELFDAQWKTDRRYAPSREQEAKDMAIAELVLEDIWDDFLLDYSLNKMASSLRPRRDGWRGHIQPYLGGYRLEEITPGVVIGWRNARIKAGVGPVAFARAMETLKLMLDYAMSLGYVSYNAAAGVTRTSRSRQKKTIVEQPERLELMRADAAGRGWRQTAFIIGVLYGTGLRPQELQALTLGDIRKDPANPGSERLLVERRVSERTIVSGTKSGRAYRFVPLHPSVSADIKAWAASLDLGSDDPLLQAMRSPFWTSAIFSAWRTNYWRPLAHDHKLVDDDPYALRHTAASLWLRDLPPAEVAEALGHSLDVLLNVYGHVIDELRGDRRPWQELLTDARRKAGTESLFGSPLLLGDLPPPKPRSKRIRTTDSD